VSLADEIGRALSTSGGVPTSLGQMIRELEQRAGSGRKAAAAAGIPETSWRRLKKGAAAERPSAATQRMQQRRAPALMGALRGMRLDKATADRWRRDDIRVTVNEPGGSARRPGGTRTIKASALDLKPGTGKKMIDAHLRGDNVAAAKAFVAGIRDDFYSSKMFGDWLDDDDLQYEGDGYDDADYAVSVAGIG
jgi:hypothetical protein